LAIACGGDPPGRAYGDQKSRDCLRQCVSQRSRGGTPQCARHSRRYGRDRRQGRPPRTGGGGIFHRRAVKCAQAGRDGGGAALPTFVGSDGIGIRGIRSPAGRLCHRRSRGTKPASTRGSPSSAWARARFAHMPQRKRSLGGGWVQKNARMASPKRPRRSWPTSIRLTMFTHLPRIAGISLACWPSAL
jgi:hypothetical protein